MNDISEREYHEYERNANERVFKTFVELMAEGDGAEVLAV
jgi:hypothetical protein